jgi:hypothetical protein
MSLRIKHILPSIIEYPTRESRGKICQQPSAYCEGVARTADELTGRLIEAVSSAVLLRLCLWVQNAAVDEFSALAGGSCKEHTAFSEKEA